MRSVTDHQGSVTAHQGSIMQRWASNATIEYSYDGYREARRGGKTLTLASTHESSQSSAWKLAGRG